MKKVIPKEKRQIYNKRYYETHSRRLKDNAIRRGKSLMAARESIDIIINGKEYTAFLVGELARRMNRSPQTIRKWEREGVIPNALRDQKGRRVYLREHIEAAIQCFEKYAPEPGKSIQKSEFPHRIKARFEHIASTL